MAPEPGPVKSSASGLAPRLAAFSAAGRWQAEGLGNRSFAMARPEGGFFLFPIVRQLFFLRYCLPEKRIDAPD